MKIPIAARTVTIRAIFGLLTAAFMMHAAWTHNPQGEFHDETGVHWNSWLTLGIFWFTAVTLTPLIITGILYFLIRGAPPEKTGISNAKIPDAPH